jgi:hypothetical protein
MGIRAKKTPRMIRAWKKAWRKYGNGERGELYIPVWRIIYECTVYKHITKKMARDIARYRYGSDTTKPGAWRNHKLSNFWYPHPVTYNGPVYGGKVNR